MEETKKLERIKVVGKGHLDPSILIRDHWLNPEMSGWLLKEGAVNRNMKKRWFVLKGNRVMYFKDEVFYVLLLYDFNVLTGTRIAQKS